MKIQNEKLTIDIIFIVLTIVYYTSLNKLTIHLFESDLLIPSLTNLVHAHIVKFAIALSIILGLFLIKQSITVIVIYCICGFFSIYMINFGTRLFNPIYHEQIESEIDANKKVHLLKVENSSTISKIFKNNTEYYMLSEFHNFQKKNLQIIYADSMLNLKNESGKIYFFENSILIDSIEYPDLSIRR